MNRVHKCPKCGRTWKHHKSGAERCPVNRKTAAAWATAIKHGFAT